MQRGVRIRLLKNVLFQGVVIVGAAMALLPLFAILFQVFRNGWRFVNWSFLVNLPRPAEEVGGGISNAIVGTVMLVAMAFIMAVPMGIGAGIYLSRSPNGRLANLTRLSLDVLQGMPSVVMGIVAYLWIVRFMNRFSALSGAAALAIMMLPIVVRYIEEVLKLIPSSLTEASLALGVPTYRTVLRVVLPCALPGMISGVLLAVVRIAGETAPLLFTAFGNRFMEWSPLKPVNSLPLIIFTNAMSPYEDLQQMAWGASVVLILLVLGTNVLARVISQKWKVTF